MVLKDFEFMLVNEDNIKNYIIRFDLNNIYFDSVIEKMAFTKFFKSIDGIKKVFKNCVRVVKENKIMLFTDPVQSKTSKVFELKIEGINEDIINQAKDDNFNFILFPQSEILEKSEKDNFFIILKI